MFPLVDLFQKIVLFIIRMNVTIRTFMDIAYITRSCKRPRVRSNANRKLNATGLAFGI